MVSKVAAKLDVVELVVCGLLKLVDWFFLFCFDCNSFPCMNYDTFKRSSSSVIVDRKIKVYYKCV